MKTLEEPYADLRVAAVAPQFTALRDDEPSLRTVIAFAIIAAVAAALTWTYIVGKTNETREKIANEPSAIAQDLDVIYGGKK